MFAGFSDAEVLGWLAASHRWSAASAVADGDVDEAIRITIRIGELQARRPHQWN